MNKAPSSDKVLKETRQRALAAKHVLQSENGQIFLGMIERECNPPKLMGDTVEKTIANVAKRDVYMYILEILSTGEEK